ncbi:MAG: GTP-binding protein, partial [Bacteroidota bacterium]
ENGRQLVPMMRHNLKHQKRDMINLLVEQIMFCSHLVLTKADRLKEVKLTDIAKFVQPINPYVTVHGVLYGNLSIEQVLEMHEYNYHRTSLLAEELKPVLEAEEHGDRPYNMATRVIKDDRPFHPQRLWEACHHYLDQHVYRSKGFFWLASRDKLSLLWNQAAGSINLELIGYWRSGIIEEEDSGLLDMEIKELKRRLTEESGRFGDRHCHLTVIGDKAQVDRFTEALKACFLSEDEIQHYQNGGKFPDPWPKNIVKVSD